MILADELAGPPETLDQLRSAGVPVVVVRRDPSLAGPPAKVRAVGRALGVPGRAEALASQVEDEIDGGQGQPGTRPGGPARGSWRSTSGATASSSCSAGAAASTR